MEYESISFEIKDVYLNPNNKTVWDCVSSLCTQVSIQSEFGEIFIEFDWDKLKKTIQFNEKDLYRKPKKEVLKCKLWASKPLSADYFSNYLYNYLNHLFLIFNLSSAGSFQLFGANYQFENAKIDNRFEFCCHTFEKTLNLDWPKILEIDPIQTWNWYKDLNIGVKQLASNCVEKAIFAMLHVCKGTICPTNLIWLAHALESLYDTPVEKISKTLQDRIVLFLEVSDDDNQKIRKLIRNFYNIRSEFVHGELGINNPDLNDVLDISMGDFINKIVDTTHFGFQIVYATLQKMIINNWERIRFYECYSGK